MTVFRVDPHGLIYNASSSGAIEPPPVGAFYSGALWAFQMWSGMYLTRTEPAKYNWKCARCNLPIGFGGNSVNITGVSGFAMIYHWSCAGFRYEQGGAVARLETREDWIRETVPLAPDAPAYVLADWLEENNRQKDADYIRRTSGG